jgi:heat shock protein HslJ/uncharacterized membrane protein
MDVRILAIFALASVALAGCERSEAPQPSPAPADTAPADAPVPPPATEAASFVNRVWAVAESKQVEPGALRVFLSDGTLVMASPNSTPAFGQWRSEDGRLTITEESRDYPTDILALSEHAFRIRINGPGEPVEILFAPAPQVAPEQATSAAPAAASRPTAAATTEAPAAPAVANLLGTAWRLESLGNGKPRAGTQPSLEFPTEGRASGNGSCNRFNGIVIVAADGIKFTGLATTRKACPEAVMRQEEDYLAALRDAVRFEADAEALRIFSAGREEPLRFVAGPAPAAPLAQGIRPAPAAATSSLLGIWTVVRHHSPGVSAMSDGQAKSHYGESLRLTANSAIAPGSRCSNPGYVPNRVVPDDFLAERFKLAPGSLKPLAGRSQMQVLQVQCDGRPWTALGGSLLELDRNRALAPWDGVFFELTRDRDFRAIGQEPGWQLEIRMGSEMRFTYDYGKGSAVTPAARAELDAKTGTRTFHAKAEANDLRVEIVPVGCEDSMSGKPFPATVTVTLNDRGFRGCGESLATPFQ